MSVIKKVLITGANGYIGTALFNFLKFEKSYDVYQASRQSQSGSKKTICISHFDRATEWGFEKTSFDVIINLAGVAHGRDSGDISNYFRVNHQGAINLAEQALSHTKHVTFIQISTIAVEHYENTNNIAFRAYGESKKLADEELMRLARRNSHCSIACLRIPMVYGKDCPGNFSILSKLITKGIPFFKFPQKNKKSFIYIENLTSAISAIIKRDHFNSKIYYLSDDQVISTNELIRELKKASNSKSPLIPLPYIFLKILKSNSKMFELIGKLTEDLVVDNKKFKKEFSWHPPFSTHEGVAKSIG